MEWKCVKCQNYNDFKNNPRFCQSCNASITETFPPPRALPPRPGPPTAATMPFVISDTSELPKNPRLVRSISSSISSQKDQETCFAHSAAYLIFHNIYNIDLSEEDVQKYNEHNCNQYLDTTRTEPNVDDLVLCGETGKSRILLFLYIYQILTLKLGCDKGYVTHSIKYYLEGNYLPPFTSQRLNDEAEALVHDKDLDLYTTSFVPIDKINVQYLKNIFDDGLYISLICVTPAHIITLVGMTESEFIAKDSYEATIFSFPIDQFNSNGIIVVNPYFQLQGIRGLTFLYKKDTIYPYYTSEFEKNYSEYNGSGNESAILTGLGISIDKKNAIDIVSINGMSLLSLTPKLKSNKEVVLAAVKNNGKALQYASPELQRDKEVVLVVVTNDGGSLFRASPELKGDKEVVLAAVTNNGYALQYASLELKADKEVVLAAVTNYGYSLQHASPELQRDKEVVMAAVTNNGGSLFYASPELKGDKEVVMAAVTNDGGSLVRASTELKGDKEVVMAAVTKDGYALQHASPELQGDKEVVMAAMSNTSEALQFASPELQEDKEVIATHGGRTKKRTRKRNRKTKRKKYLTRR